MKKLIFPALILLSLSFTLTQQSCVGSRVVLNARYDSTFIRRVEGLKDMTAAMYSLIQNSEDKSFELHKPVYIGIDNGLIQIVADEATRSKNKAIEFQAQTTLDIFRKYMKEHELKGVITNSQAKVYAKYMNDIFAIWLKTEKSLNK